MSFRPTGRRGDGYYGESGRCPVQWSLQEVGEPGLRLQRLLHTPNYAQLAVSTMNKQDRLLDHLRDPKNRDPRSPVTIGPNPDRLSFIYMRGPGGWHDVARFIRRTTQEVAWFPDANVAFLEPTTPVWDALRLTALGSPGGSTVISGVVEYEMAEWLKNPYHNKSRAADIAAAMASETWLKKFRMGPSQLMYKALYGYTRLLGFRRTLARPLADGSTLVGTLAAEKSQTLNAIRNRLGLRAEGLAKKGRIDHEKCGIINISDEMHCLMVILYALETRRPSVMLTTDSDHLEIFYKAQWFFDTHYRAWLAAKLIVAGQYGSPAKELPDTDGHFQGPLTLYRRHTLHLQEVLGPMGASVKVGLIYVAPDGTLHLMSFPFELPMLDMLETRSKTDGRCTDLFGDANVHIDLGPLKPKLDGLYLGIGRDVIHSFEADGVRASVARLDLQHSIACFERFSA